MKKLLLSSCICSTILLSSQTTVADDAKIITNDKKNSVSIVNENKDVTISDYAGHWVVYVVAKGNKNYIPDYSYSIGEDGKWYINTAGEIKENGIVDFFSDKLIFVLNNEKANDKGEIRGMPATTYNPKVITLQSDSQMHTYLQLEHKNLVDLVAPKDVIGEWQLFQMSNNRDETRKAPFYLNFKIDGTYQVVDNKGNVDDINSGTWKIENGLIALSNKNTEKDSLWYQTKFFLDSDRIILNRLESYLYGEKK